MPLLKCSSECPKIVTMSNWSCSSILSLTFLTFFYNDFVEWWSGVLLSLLVLSEIVTESPYINSWTDRIQLPHMWHIFCTVNGCVERRRGLGAPLLIEQAAPSNFFFDNGAWIIGKLVASKWHPFSFHFSSRHPVVVKLCSNVTRSRQL